MIHFQVKLDGEFQEDSGELFHNLGAVTKGFFGNQKGDYMECRNNLCYGYFWELPQNTGQKALDKFIDKYQVLDLINICH